MPNEPPTLPVSTRTLSGVVLSTSLASPPRKPITPWQPTRSTQRPFWTLPIAARGPTPHPHRPLPADPQPPAPVLHIADPRARLHRVDDDAVGIDLEPRDVRRI